MHTKRVIPCLDVKDGRVVKGVNFVNFRDAGDPSEVAAAYDAAGADEVVFLDITASADSRATQLEWVRKVASKVFIPFTVGGGIRTVDDFKAILREGADKISVNSAAIMNPRLISDAAEKFGSQCVVVAIDAKKEQTAAVGIFIKTAVGWIWAWMPWNGREPQRRWGREKYCLPVWTETAPRRVMTWHLPELWQRA